MVISASRRTDIPAFYAPWFMNRIRAGFCEVPNPRNPSRVSRVSLQPGDVDAIVFWTRDPRPLLSHLDELDSRGYRYYFLFTVMENPSLLDPGTPGPDTAIAAFRQLAERVTPERVTWRYDPVILSSCTDAAFHRETYARLANRLQGFTRHCIISMLDLYPKVRRRLAELEAVGVRLQDWDADTVGPLMRFMADTAAANGMDIASCAEKRDLVPYGIPRGRCIDAASISRTLGVEASRRKDPSQRPLCGCTVSRDIGAYDTCLFGCRYCYATTSPERAQERHRRHRPEANAIVS